MSNNFWLYSAGAGLLASGSYDSPEEFLASNDESEGFIVSDLYGAERYRGLAFYWNADD